MTILPAPPPDWKRPAIPAKTCEECGAQFYRQVAHGGGNAWSRRRFCSQGCYWKAKRLSVEQYIERYVTKKRNGCWNWRGPLCEDGYPSVGSKYLGSERFVRIVYAHFVAEIPKDHAVSQTCRNKRCVCPEHLELVGRTVPIGVAHDAAPKGFRKSMHMKLKLRVVAFHGTNCSGCGKPVKAITEAHFDHDPAIHLRAWDIEAQDTVPACNDYRFIRIMHASCHIEKTKDDRRAIAKTRRIVGKKSARFSGPARGIDIGTETVREPKKPGKTIQSRGFDKTRRRKFNGEVEVRT